MGVPGWKIVRGLIYGAVIVSLLNLMLDAGFSLTLINWICVGIFDAAIIYTIVYVVSKGRGREFAQIIFYEIIIMLLLTAAVIFSSLY